MEIFPGIHWLQARYANVYLCVDGEGVALIDTGPPGHATTILDYAASLASSKGELNRIFITHADWDHAGSLAALHENTRATIFASSLTVVWMGRGRGPRHLPRPVQWLADRIGTYDPVNPDWVTVVEPDETVPLLGGATVVGTPGHTPDHISLHAAAAGVLFAGDALGSRSGLGLPNALITADREDARASARHLLSLAPALFACGHGEPVQGHSLPDLMNLLQELK